MEHLIQNVNRQELQHHLLKQHHLLQHHQHQEFGIVHKQSKETRNVSTANSLAMLLALVLDIT
jgi:hypothetical protein